jgi:hypothetical protein
MNALLEADENVRTRILRQYGRDIDVLDNLLLEINHGCATASGREHDHGLSLLHLLLITHAFNALWQARQSLSCGYPIPSLILCRTAFEDWAALEYCVRHPEHVGDVLSGVTHAVDNPRIPSFRDIFKEMKAVFGPEVGQVYGMLSEYAHPRAPAMLGGITGDRSQAWTFRPGPRWDGDQIRFGLHYLIMIGERLLRQAMRAHKMIRGDYDEEWIHVALEAHSKAEAFLIRSEDYFAKYQHRPGSQT